MPHSQMCTTAGNDAGMDDDILSDIVPPRVGMNPSKTSLEAGEGEAKQENGGLATKRMEMAKAKIADAVRRWSYLLGQTGPFEHSIHQARLLPRICRAHVRRAAEPKRSWIKMPLFAFFPAFRALLVCPSHPPRSLLFSCTGTAALRPSDNYARHRKSTKQGDNELLKYGEAGLPRDDQRFHQLQASTRNGPLPTPRPRLDDLPAQDGFNGISILADDEMGLGKAQLRSAGPKELPKSMLQDL
ncbi:hypothetical protein D9619_000024 [Psilocybe cf. subviscida]|uniref:Uncharacterized protein n=1 Tax=Psilocybe cf. subviscida TaxID=2480587 RepID=A0A8H5BCF4_9AGAR|nr:hypothetical protein D9619_000024 [Psilocybe cf. subviscida]